MAAQQSETYPHYRPIVDADGVHINTFRCRPYFRAVDGTVFGTEVVLGHKGDIENTAARNALVLKLAFKALTRARTQDDDVKLIVPINSVALASREGRIVIHHAFEELLESLRSLIIVEVLNLPEKVSIDSLSDITIPMIPFTQNFIAEPHPATEDFTVFANCNYQGMIFDVSSFGDDIQVQRDKLTDFWAAATKARLKLMVRNIGGQEIADMAVRLEAQGMDGSLFGPDSTHLGPLSTVEEWPGVATLPA